MPVPASINDLSTTAGSNYPAGSESPATLDDYQRAHASFIAQLRDGKQPLDSMLTALAALTSANGQFLAFTAADMPAVRAMVGAVSQSGGVATGSIVEKGSNANGEYMKLADGTQVCWRLNFGNYTATTASGSLFTGSSDQSWTFPASFPAKPWVGSGAENHVRICTGAAADGTSATLRQYSTTSSGTGVSFNAVAIGRWY